MRRADPFDELGERIHVFPTPRGCPLLLFFHNLLFDNYKMRVLLKHREGPLLADRYAWWLQGRTCSAPSFMCCLVWHHWRRCVRLVLHSCAVVVEEAQSA